MRLFRRGDGASTLDLLVAGLGNPGPRHARDRHNAGWMVVDELARRQDGSFRAKFNGRIGETRIGDDRIALLEPETYMNESGRSVSAAARFFKVAPEDVLVVHDEVDLDVGRLQARAGAGSPVTTGSARSRRRSGPRTSCACESGSGGPGAGIRAPWPTSSCRRSHPRGPGRDRLPSRRRRRGPRVRGRRRDAAPVQLRPAGRRDASAACTTAA